MEKETDWGLSTANWSAAVHDFFRRNHATVDGELLEAALANIVSNGPSETAQVPFIAGVTNI